MDRRYCLAAMWSAMKAASLPTPASSAELRAWVRALLGFDHQATGCRVLAQRNDPEAAAQRRVDQRRVLFN
jgi:hypothetical protein